MYLAQGLAAFPVHEETRASQSLPPGRFKPLLEALHKIQLAAGKLVEVRLRTAPVTARSAPAHERAIRTLVNPEH